MKHYKHYTSAEFLSIFGMSSPPAQIGGDDGSECAINVPFVMFWAFIMNWENQE